MLQCSYEFPLQLLVLQHASFQSSSVNICYFKAGGKIAMNDYMAPMVKVTKTHIYSIIGLLSYVLFSGKATKRDNCSCKLS